MASINKLGAPIPAATLLITTLIRWTYSGVGDMIITAKPMRTADAQARAYALDIHRQTKERKMSLRDVMHEPPGLAKKETPEEQSLAEDNISNHKYLFIWTFNLIVSAFLAPLYYNDGSYFAATLLAAIMIYSAPSMVNAMNRITDTDGKIADLG